MNPARKLGLIACSCAVLGCSGATTAAPPAAPVGLKGTPAVVAASWTTAPAHSVDLKVTCAQPGSPSDTCPVISWDGIMFWAFSYADNRSSLAIVAFDATGKALGTLDRPGARYVAQVTIDPSAQTVALQGQAAATVSATWDELRAIAK